MPVQIVIRNGTTQHVLAQALQINADFKLEASAVGLAETGRSERELHEKRERAVFGVWPDAGTFGRHYLVILEGPRISGRTEA